MSIIQQAGRAMARAMARWFDADMNLMLASDLRCPKCGKQYKKLAWLRRHYRGKHGASG